MKGYGLPERIDSKVKKYLSVFGAVLFLMISLPLAAIAAPPPSSEIQIVLAEGQIEVLSQGASHWVPTTATNQVFLYPKDSVRTGPKSKLGLQWPGQSMITFGPLTEIEILPAEDSSGAGGLHLLQGVLSFFHRDKPGHLKVVTHAAVAGIRGTEFVLSSGVEGTNVDVLSVIDGEVSISNDFGSLTITNSEQALVRPGQAPKRTAGFIANNVLQWSLYYPGVIDLAELRLAAPQRDTLRGSLEAYRSGDLLAALASYPDARKSDSSDETIFHAALLLSVGEIRNAEDRLAQVNNTDAHSQHLANALRLVIAAVKRQTIPYDPNNLTLASEKLAASYYEQSRPRGDLSLTQARAMALAAAAQSPSFSFAWARAAEMEFSFGRTSQARDFTEKALVLSPRNAQAVALKGFLLAADNRVREAQNWFNRAIAIDPALANAWLGRGLCRIRSGDLRSGREDLLVAAGLEPQRAVLRSYLGKAFSDEGENRMATQELKLARKLDPNDPTGWLYSALLKQQGNQINSAIEDLEISQEHNKDRSLFRSQLLLDEDRAVGSANLASIYRDAGMTDVSIREAARAVTYDYANASAHLFLSDSYNEFRDPTRFNLRYETVWFSELLLANLLSPVGGGRLSQHLSQQEYSKLFEQDGFGFANSTLVRTDNKSVTELATQFGTIGSISYSLDLDYQHNDGVRPNNDLDSIEWYSTFKQQVTERDTFFALAKYEDFHSGDNFQYYDPKNARPVFRFDEYQHPIVVGAWHHEWSPGMHTILLGGRLETEQHFSDTGVPEIRIDQFSDRTIAGVFATPFDLEYHNRFEIYTAELNQIFQWQRVTLSLGGRYQSGTFHTEALLDNPASAAFFYVGTPTNTAATDDMERFTGYGYLTVEPVDHLWLTAGVAYDDITYPRNFRAPPISPGQDSRSQLGPKAALVYQPISAVTLRGIYTKSLGGVSLDESYRLEPTQLAGFPQTFRSLISESVVGSVAAPEYQTFGGALDIKLPTKTFIGFQAERLESDVRGQIGLFVVPAGVPPAVVSSTKQNLDYAENSVTASIHQLLGEGFSAGLSYRYEQADLGETFPDSPAYAKALNFNDRANLHQLTCGVLYNDPSGFFARADAAWYHQGNEGVGASRAGDDFVQENCYIGKRFLNRRIELLLGILNLSGQDYHLNPITVYSELPRKRSFVARLNFVF
jgi:tetratricopeptide (TPR) repeat protein